MDTLHKDYKDEISEIKKRHEKDSEFIAKILEIDNRFNKIIEQGKSPVRGFKALAYKK